LPRPEFEEQEIWDRLYAADESQLASGIVEHSRTDGEDGEREFDRRVLSRCRGKNVIDIGCGTGEFTLEVAATARHVVGIDFSTRALAKALENQRSKAVSNVEFKFSRADKLPYSEESFDHAVSRRGPMLDTQESIREVYRVLRKDGQILAQEIGERDKQNWAELFGARGQMYPFGVSIGRELRKRLSNAGFREIHVDEFEANEYFETIQDVLVRMENSPIIPDFDKERDDHLVREIAKRFTAPKGIATTTHRVLIEATK
jgi:ubiquinone/menaquinone biosynthesis C-methylase UbiE